MITGPAARRFIYDRTAASRRGHGVLYQTEIDRRMIPEIFRAFDSHVSVAAQVDGARPIIREHLRRWVSQQQLDFQAACRELAFAIGWYSQLGETAPDDHGARLVWDFLYHPGVREQGAGYARLVERIGQGVVRAEQAGAHDDAFVVQYLREEHAGRMDREGTIDALIHGLGTTVALVKSFCVMLVELTRTHDTAHADASAWREVLLADEPALQAVVTEAFSRTPIVPTMTVAVDRSAESGCPFRIHDTEIPHGAQVQYSVYGENYEASFDRSRWKDDPLDAAQRSATFAGVPHNDGARNPQTGLPDVIYCPAKALMHGFAVAFLRELLTGLNWEIQALPPGPPPPLPLLVTYPEGLLGYAAVRDVSLPRRVPPKRHTERRIAPGERVIVVGGGIGGLAAARELQKRGCKVTVLEASDRIGAGKCETLSIDGRAYNVGAHIVRREGPVQALAAEVGIEIEPYLGRHQKFAEAAGDGTHRDGLELLQSGSLVTELLAGADAECFGFLGLGEFAASVDGWRPYAKSFVDFVHPFFYGAGYGPAAAMSTAYLLRFADASRHSLQSPDRTGTPAGGFGHLLRALAADVEVRCGQRVVATNRSDDGVSVQIEDGSLLDADHLFVAANRPLAFLDGDDEETALLSQLRYLPYITGIIRAEGLSRDGFCVSDDPARQSPVASYTYYHADTDVLIWWGYAASGQSDAEFLSASLTRLEAMGARFTAGREPLFLQRWDYVPHVAPGDLAAGFYERLERRQGVNRTWFGGGLTAFELTDCIAGWTCDFIERICGELVNRPWRVSEVDPVQRFAATPLPSDKRDLDGVDGWFDALGAAFPTLLHAFRHHAETKPDQEFIVSLERGRRAWSFREMWEEASTVAALVESAGLRPGDRAVLVYPPDSVHFPAALYACFLSGVIAVPVAPPIPLKGDTEGLERFNRIVKDAGAVAALTDSRYHALTQVDRPLQSVRSALRGKRSLGSRWPSGLRWIRTDKAPAGKPSSGRLPMPDDIAYVQYTSGSTRDPRGVVITHGMLMHNAIMSSRDCRVFPPQRGLAWLPWWHDLMLVIGFCVPPILGTTIVYFSAIKWLSNPSFWLEACAAEGIGNTAAPNFALELMIKRADLSKLTGVDLTDMIIYSGAEVCRPATHDAFIERFGAFGLRFWNIRNIMGMAECTLYLSGGRDGDSRYTRFDRHSLRAGMQVVEVSPEHPNGQTIIACGPPVAPDNDTSSVIVDPNSGDVVPMGIVGELWIRGPSVANGHIRPAAEDSERFGVPTAAPESRSRFFRTGDLAFLHRGMVYVCGRVKELIITGGRNLVPMDIEDVVGRAHPAIREGCVVAFGVEDQGTEVLCVVAELRASAYRKRASSETLDGIVAAIVQAVGHAVNERCRYIGLVAQRSLPKTTSGKLRRVDVRRRFSEGVLSLVAPVYAFDIERAKADPVTGQAADRAAAGPVPVGPVEPAQAAAWIKEVIANLAGIEPGSIEDHQSFTDFGIDSLGAVEAMMLLGDRSGQRFGPSDLFNFPTINALATAISARSVSRAMSTNPYVVLNDHREDGDGLLDGSRTLFCMPPGGGHVFAYVHLAQHLSSRTLVAFENRSAESRTPMVELARRYAEVIRGLQPEGPWHLLAYSLGGVTGALVAEALGDCDLVLIDGLAPNLASYTSDSVAPAAFESTAATGRRMAERSGQLVVEDDDAAVMVEAQMAWDLFSAAQVSVGQLAVAHRDRHNGAVHGVHVVQLRAPEPEDGIEGTLLETLQNDPSLGWGSLVDGLENRVIPGGHFSVVGPRHAEGTAREVAAAFDASPYAKRTPDSG
ncbi:MAG TPA: FAD-dependent oxidoreductase [Gammaproteobacteria bacterium]|nr:FAD-dependent oxidoreductase [Gammaproteobacteria bacterium]